MSALLPEREPLRVTCAVMGCRVINNAKIPIKPGVHAGLRAKQHAVPSDSYGRSLNGANAEKRAGYKAGI